MAAWTGAYEVVARLVVREERERRLLRRRRPRSSRPSALPGHKRIVVYVEYELEVGEGMRIGELL